MVLFWLVTIGSVGVLHVLASGLDQFVRNVILMRGHKQLQVPRDLYFMISDLLNLCAALIGLSRLYRPASIASQLLKRIRPK